MGMFEKDKVFGGKRLDQEFADGEEFILIDGEIVATDVDTGHPEMGGATKTVLKVAKLNAPDAPFEVGTFASAIASKIEEKEDGDLPAVVSWTKVSTDKGNDATVIQLARAYDPAQETVPAGE